MRYRPTDVRWEEWEPAPARLPARPTQLGLRLANGVEARAAEAGVGNLSVLFEVLSSTVRPVWGVMRSKVRAPTVLLPTRAPGRLRYLRSM